MKIWLLFVCFKIGEKAAVLNTKITRMPKNNEKKKRQKLME